MLSECFWDDLALFKKNFALKSCSTSLPGGDQVDGLPPAASTEYSSIETGATTELFGNFGKFF